MSNPLFDLPLQVVQACMRSVDRTNYSDQLVSPDLARQWLDKWNTRNRRFKLDSAELYASEMKRGNWTRGSRIIFYSDGVLCDGQNRLLAVCKSGVSCLFDVLVGASIEEGSNIDTGSKRSAHDALQIKGAPDWIANKDCVALINNIHRLGTARHSQRLTHHAIQQFAVKNESWIKPVYELMKVSRKRKLTGSVYSANLAVAVFNGESFDEIADFNHRYFSGENYDITKNAVTRLREYVLDYNGTPWSLPNGIDTAKRTQRAIKAFVSRQAISKLYAPTEWIYRFPIIDDMAS